MTFDRSSSIWKLSQVPILLVWQVLLVIPPQLRQSQKVECVSLYSELPVRKSDHIKTSFYVFISQTPVVQRVDNVIQWINRYAVDKMYSNQYILSAG